MDDGERFLGLIAQAEHLDYPAEALAQIADEFEAYLAEASRARLNVLARELEYDPHRLLANLREAADPEVRRAADDVLADRDDNCCDAHLPPRELALVSEDPAVRILARRALEPLARLARSGLL